MESDRANTKYRHKYRHFDDGVTKDRTKTRGFDNERRSASFKCSHCGVAVSSANRESVGTEHRDHCPYCLWSKHLDVKPGDRKSECRGGMKPIGMTLKMDKGQMTGEPMVVYECAACGTVHKNRCAADDRESVIIQVFFDSLAESSESQDQPNLKLKDAGITLLGQKDAELLLTRLFGKDHIPQEYLEKARSIN